MIRASEHLQKQPSHAEGFFMPNTCKERYECNNCCKDMIALINSVSFLFLCKLGWRREEAWRTWAEKAHLSAMGVPTQIKTKAH